MSMRRVPELDAVRGLAALTILLYHVCPYRLFFGWAGVDLFFVLSGYLITSIILENRGTRGFFFTFYARRGLRIWPIYYLTILALALIHLCQPHPDGSADSLPYYLTYSQNVPLYWSDWAPAAPALVHTWSLAAEEQFYLVWPVLICLVPRRFLVPLMAAVAATAVAARGAGFHLHLLLTRCDGFALGSILAVVLREQLSVPNRRNCRIGLALAGLAALAYLIGGVCVFGRRFLGEPNRADVPMWPALTIVSLNLLFASAIGLIVHHTGRPLLAPLRGRALAYLGQISYGLYLYHWVVFKLCAQLGEALGVGTGLGADVAQLAVTFLIAVLSWKYVERPILALKDWFGYGPLPERARAGESRRPHPGAAASGPRLRLVAERRVLA